MSRTRSRAAHGVVAAVALVAALALAGCGGSSAAEGGGAASTGQASAGAGGEGDAGSGGDHFPVTIDSALGEATITEPPKRIVTIGAGAAETAIALGQVPVGTEQDTWASDDTGDLPWVRAAVQKAGGKLPEHFTGGTELDIEAVAELRPDVILAPWSGITQQQFDLLSQIAPTVAYPGKPWDTAWDKEIRLVGAALGKPEQAQHEIDRINARLATVRRQNPAFSRHTFVYTYTNGPGTFGTYLADEQRVTMLRKMGLELLPKVKRFEAKGGTFYTELGLENVDTVKDADLLFTWYLNDKTRKQVLAQPLYANIPAVKRGSVVASENHSFVTASSMINPLTVPWSVDRYVPMIHRAINRLGD